MKISEKFYSIQGEGPLTGTPCLFIRFGQCPNHCKWCDTVEVWQKWTEESPESVLEWALKVTEKNERQHASVVLTGGDPMLHQEDLVNFILNYSKHRQNVVFQIETHGVTKLKPAFARLYATLGRPVIHWNISPKLANNGEPKKKRLNVETLASYIQSSATRDYCLKFVIDPRNVERDMFELEEVVADISEHLPFPIEPPTIWLMPMADSREDLAKHSETIAKEALESGYNFSTRLHLTIWDKKTGV